jgi:hypothetical protein
MDTLNGLAFFVLSTVVFILGALLHRWIPWRDKASQLGAFLIVYTALLLAWLERNDPAPWVQVAVSVFGVVLLRFSTARERQRRDVKGPERPPASVSWLYLLGPLTLLWKEFLGGFFLDVSLDPELERLQ